MSCTNSITAPELLVKQPSEKLIYTFDFSERIDSGVTISTATVDSELVSGDASTLVITSVSIDGENVVCFIAGGINGRTYGVEATANLSNGEILLGRGMLKVLER